MSRSVVESVRLIHGPDEISMAVAIASEIAARHDIGVGLAREKDARVRWYVFRPSRPLEDL